MFTGLASSTLLSYSLVPLSSCPILRSNCSDALNRDDGNWYHYNDGHVTRTSASRLSGSAAYLLFFVRSDLL